MKYFGKTLTYDYIKVQQTDTKYEDKIQEEAQEKAQQQVSEQFGELADMYIRSNSYNLGNDFDYASKKNSTFSDFDVTNLPSDYNQLTNEQIQEIISKFNIFVVDDDSKVIKESPEFALWIMYIIKLFYAQLQGLQASEIANNFHQLMSVFSFGIAPTIYPEFRQITTDISEVSCLFDSGDVYLDVKCNTRLSLYGNCGSDLPPFSVYDVQPGKYVATSSIRLEAFEDSPEPTLISQTIE